MKISIILYLFIYLLLGSCVPLNTPLNNASNLTSPTPTISDASTFDAVNNTITFTLNYTNAQNITLKASDVTLIKTGTANGIISISGTGLTYRTITISNITGIGTLSIKVASQTATSALNIAYPGFGPSAALSVFSPPSTVGISLPSAVDTHTGPVSFTINYGNATSISLSASDIISNLRTTGTSHVGSVAVTGTGLSIRTVTLSSITGDGTVGILVPANTARDVNGSYYPASSASNLITTHGTGPTIAISAPSKTITTTSSVTYTVTYTGATTISLADTDILPYNPSSGVTATAHVTTTGANTRLVTFSSISGNGLYGFSIKADSARDIVGNPAAVSSSSQTFTVDNLAPTLSLGAPFPTSTNTGPVILSVTYTGADTITLSNTNIHLRSRSGNASGSVFVTGSGNTKTISVGNLIGDGVLYLTIDPSTASDLAGNYEALGATSADITIINQKPAVVFFNGPSSAIVNHTGSVTYTIQYVNAQTITLSNLDISVSATNGVATVGSITTGPSLYGAAYRQVTLSNITGDADVSIAVNAGTSLDSVGNADIGSSASPTFKVDNTPPVITFNGSSPSYTDTNSSRSVTYTLTYSSTVADPNPTISLDNSIAGKAFIVLTTSPTVTNATVAVSGTGNTRIITLSNLQGFGTVQVGINADSAVDAAGNKSIATTCLSPALIVDNTPPSIAISAASPITTDIGPVTYNITYTGSSLLNLNPPTGTGFVTLNRRGTANATITVAVLTSTTATVTLDQITGDGWLSISLAAGTATDLASNTAAAFGPSSEFAVVNDPLFPQSWHLHNSGVETAYSTGHGLSGIDLNLLGTWGQDIIGTNVNVLVSDTGVESTHDAIKNNFYTTATASKDFINGTAHDYFSLLALPAYNLVDFKIFHGTAVAGIIAASGGHGTGGARVGGDSIGVAPGAMLASANFLRPGSTATSSDKLFDQVSDSVDSTLGTISFDIINQSWGTDECSLALPNSSYELKLNSGLKNYIKSAGNSFDADIGPVLNGGCGNSTVIGTTRHANANFDPYNVNPYTIVVAAVNAMGVKSSYSTTGSNIWISGLGGEFGDTAPAIITTDLMGDVYGESTLLNLNYYNPNPFQYKTHPLNPNCNYTSMMNGTSAAAPTVSGVVALILSANPNLKTHPRDIKHILATTATKIDASSIPPDNAHIASPVGYTWEQGWVTNNALYHFHNYYGFGLVNADAAVTMAQNNYTLLANAVETIYQSSGTINLPIPTGFAGNTSNLATVARNPITIAAGIFTHNFTETVMIKPNITHPNIGRLGIELVSPRGTKSILMNINNSLEGQIDIAGEVFLSNAFYGEDPTGDWTITIIDPSTGLAGTPGTLIDWQIKFTGH